MSCGWFVVAFVCLVFNWLGNMKSLINLKSEKTDFTSKDQK